MPRKRRPRDTLRRRAMWRFFDFGQGHGLEIGPLARPIVMQHEADVEYVDVLDTEGLRAHYADDAGVPVEAIRDVDYHLIQADGTVLSLVEATHAGSPFDWVMASHVIEHVPDVVGWLGEIAEITVDGGALVLIVPDRRYCFDVIRPPTTVGQMIAAHEARDVVPSVRAVYDYFSGVVDYSLPALWADEVPGFDRRLYSVPTALEHARRSLAGEYVDCHVWLWTPDSFLLQLHELRTAGLSEWYVESLVPTPREDLEFKVVLRRLDRGQDATTARPLGELRSESARPDWVEDRLRARDADALRRRVEALEGKLTDRTRELEALRGSRRYRVGSAVAAVPDRIRSVLRR